MNSSCTYRWRTRGRLRRGGRALGGKSSGLSGMHERASLLAGGLRIEAAPGRGTCVSPACGKHR